MISFQSQSASDRSMDLGWRLRRDCLSLCLSWVNQIGRTEGPAHKARLPLVQGTVYSHGESVSEMNNPLIFLSHSGEDTPCARELAQLLRPAGVDVWLDVERLQPGDRWGQ